MAPILTLIILAIPVSRPPLKFFAGFVITLVLSVYASFLLLPLLLNQRLAGLILAALALFHTFYFTARGKAAVVGMFLTIGITVTVALGSVSVDLLLAVAEGLAVGAIVGAGVAWLMHMLMPDPPMELPPAKAPAPLPGLPARRAFRSLMIVLPVTIWFLLSSASASYIGVMIKVATMGQEASGAAAGGAAKSLIASTLAGGLAAVGAWELLSIWPSLAMYTLLVATASLWFAGKIFEGAGLSKNGDTWTYGLLTMLVILAPSALDAQLGNAADISFYNRLLMFIGASIYGVGAVYVFDSFWPPRAADSGPAVRQAGDKVERPLPRQPAS